MELCLSTAWNAFRYNNGIEIIKEIRNLGFAEVELSFDLTERIVKDISNLVAKGQIKVNALHNFCPIPDGVPRAEALPDCYSLASCDEQRRALAVTYTKVTIDTAAALNARAVVLHAGRVEIEDRTRELISCYNNGQMQAPHAQSIRAQMHKERKSKEAAHFQAALKSLEELVHYAKNLSLSLGIENRFYFREIPSFEEVGKILDYFKGSNISYWHDTGHAQLWENLGFLKHQEYLDRYAQYLSGVHLHDIQGTRDHLAPLQGSFDFALLKPYLKNDTVKTIEAHYPVSSQDIIAAKHYLEKLYPPTQKTIPPWRGE